VSKSAIPVIQFRIQGVVQDDAAVFRDFIQRVSPGIVKRRRQSMPFPHTEGCLERVVVGGARTAKLTDGVIVRVSIKLVDIGDVVELPSFAPNVSDGENRFVSDSFFNLKIVVEEVRCDEVLIHREQIESWRIRAIRIVAGLDGWKDVLFRHPSIALRRSTGPGCESIRSTDTVGRNRSKAIRIPLNPLSRGDRRPEVQERTHVDLVIEHSNAPAKHKISTAGWLIGEADSWSEVVPV